MRSAYCESEVHFSPTHFTGKERDTESGNDYFGARYYSSNMGRFMSPDKPFADQHASNPQSWNLYSYTRNNPLRFVDDDGEAVRENPVSKNYTVSGKTAAEAWNNAPGPAAAAGIPDGNRGNTAWSMQVGPYNYDPSLQTSDSSATVTETVSSGDVLLTVTTQLPVWDGYSSASPAEQKKWDDMTSNLKGHEDGHKAIDEKNANSLDKSLPGTTGTGTAPTVPEAETKAKDALSDNLHSKQNDAVQKTAAENKAYDDKNHHGDY